jgi:hypothetical protein
LIALRIHALALHFMGYNVGRIHETIRSTPAMRAGVTDHKWSVEERVARFCGKEFKLTQYLRKTAVVDPLFPSLPSVQFLVLFSRGLGGVLW